MRSLGDLGGRLARAGAGLRRGCGPLRHVARRAGVVAVVGARPKTKTRPLRRACGTNTRLGPVFVKLQYNTADASAWQAFDAWLRVQPAHALVWERLQAPAFLQRVEHPGRV
ncbi:FecR/PupR family sigma factor regulator [Achromobacter sp. UMC46]|uniref:FecR/PupR family sigma factor regulator n=1 Tax=Achromobacter sp. UMC46 TaxID=1862319 RepID=UPI00351C4A3A